MNLKVLGKWTVGLMNAPSLLRALFACCDVLQREETSHPFAAAKQVFARQVGAWISLQRLHSIRAICRIM